MIERWFAPWKKRILSMIGKCIINAVSDDGNLQTLQITYLKDEVMENVERVQEFGFTSHPPANSEAIVACVGGNQQHPVIIATDNSRFRLKSLPEGAVAIYNNAGDFVKITDNKIEISGDEILIGNGSAFKKLVNEEFQSLFNNHVHLVSTVGTAAAQAGVSSSPAAFAGTGPINVPPSPNPPYPTFANNLTDSQLTSKAKAE